MQARPRGSTDSNPGGEAPRRGRETLSDVVTEIVIILALVLANGVFAGAEMALVSLRRTRLQQLVEEKRAGARAAAKLRSHPEGFLATVQIGITVVSSAAAAFGGAALASRLVSPLRGVPALAPYADELAFGAVVASVSYLSLVLGELVPKSLALRSSERYALIVAQPLQALSVVAKPLVWFLTKSSNVILRPFGDRTTFTEARISAEEIELLVDEAGRAGALDQPTAEIASRALAFRELTAGEVMVPRSRVVALRRDADQDELRQQLLEEGRSRMPVYDGTLDDIVGYVMAKDLAALAFEKELIVLEDLLRPVHYVPQTARAVHVLKDMQRRRTQLAVVVDEHGGVAGLVTLEDLVEELVGEIIGEEEEQPEALLRREADGSILVRGEAPLREVNRALELELPEGEGYTTVAGLCIAIAGAVPERGARLTAADVELEVVDASPRLVRLVRLRPPARRGEVHPEGGQDGRQDGRPPGEPG